jgi:nucleotide-binding universal stress UspA family protein/hemerythrin-like domain-containing protein
MYTHILVPIDGTQIAISTAGSAVKLASSLGAKVTFFHARADYAATGDGALQISLDPKGFVEQEIRSAMAILAKAEADARALGVECQSLTAISASPYVAILAAAEAHGCDLIFMSSHGRRGLKGLMLGSQTQKVLAHTSIPVLVSSVESNQQQPQMHAAISILKEEHRSLAAVIHGLQHVAELASVSGVLPEQKLLRAMIRYLKHFPNSLHHPKEEVYLFDRLRRYTGETDEVITTLRAEHRQEGELIATLEDALAKLDAEGVDGIEPFVKAVEKYAEALWAHISLEEKVIIPALQRHLLQSDWVDIAKAFGENGDPLFEAERDSGFKELFAHIMVWAQDK